MPLLAEKRHWRHGHGLDQDRLAVRRDGLLRHHVAHVLDVPAGRARHVNPTRTPSAPLATGFPGSDTPAPARRPDGLASHCTRRGSLPEEAVLLKLLDQPSAPASSRVHKGPREHALCDS